MPDGGSGGEKRWAPAQPTRPACSDQDWAEWEDFYLETLGGLYSGAQEVPEPPRLIRDLLANPDSPPPKEFSKDDLSVLGINGPVELYRFYEEYRFLPAPVHPRAGENELAIKQYSLASDDRREQIDRNVELAAAVFKAEVSLVTILTEARQWMIGETGWDGPSLTRPAGVGARSMATACSFCTHAALAPDPDNVCVVFDTASDWRWINNPFVKSGAVLFYASAPLFVPAPGLDGSTRPQNVGNIVVIGRTPRPRQSFSESDGAILRNIAAGISRELRLGREMFMRKREADGARYLSSMLRTALVSTQTHGALSNASPGMSAVLAEQQKSDLLRDDELLRQAASKLVEHTSADGCQLLDLRTFYSTEGVGAEGRGTVRVLGSKGFDPVSQEELLRMQGILATAMSEYHPTPAMGSFPTRLVSGLAPPWAKSVLALPVLAAGGNISIVVLLASVAAQSLFDEIDVQFAKAVGTSCLLWLSQRDVFDSDSAKLAFVSHVSHELRTPIYSIATHIELLRAQLNEESIDLDALLRLLDVADVSVDALRDIVDDSLDFSRVNVGKSVTEMSPTVAFNLLDLLLETAKVTWQRSMKAEEVVARGEDGAGPGRSSRVSFTFAADASTENWEGEGSAADIKRIATNLVSNAAKYTESGWIKATLTREDDAKGRPGWANAILTVSDSGVGMEEHFLRSGRVFLAFVQENSFAPGIGVGLSMCHTIVTRMGGTINIDSTKGVGTSVRVVLPLRLQPMSLAAHSRAHVHVISDLPRSPLSPRLGQVFRSPRASMSWPKASPPLPHTGGASKKDVGFPKKVVLVAEDNKISRQIVVALLKKKKLDYVAVDDGLQAVDAYKTHHPFLSIVDLQMPHCDGLTASSQIRGYEKSQNLPRSKIVILSSLSNKEDISKALASADAPIDEWIVKGGTSLRMLNALFDQL